MSSITPTLSTTTQVNQRARVVTESVVAAYIRELSRPQPELELAPVPAPQIQQVRAAVRRPCGSASRRHVAQERRRAVARRRQPVLALAD
jgi:hypothetical protein